MQLHHSLISYRIMVVSTAGVGGRYRNPPTYHHSLRAVEEAN